jgi:hypothetical protein
MFVLAKWEQFDYDLGFSFKAESKEKIEKI